VAQSPKGGWDLSGLQAALSGGVEETEQTMFKTIFAIAALGTATACAPFWSERDDKTSRGWFSPSIEAAQEDGATHAGAQSYAANCAACHGATGHGDGKHATDLPVAPPDLTQLSSANAGVFPAERVMETVHGYPGKFHRGTMPEFGPELAGPVVEWRSPSGTVVLTPKGLMDLVSYVESLQDIAAVTNG
jgi:mono/diheme cytochrome c family protein